MSLFLGLSTTVTVVEELDYSEHGKSKFNLDKMTKFVYLVQNKIIWNVR